MGGTDDPSNLIELTVEEHAEAHRKLFQEHGHWQDELAWKGLAGIIPKAEIVRSIQSEAGKSGRGKKMGPQSPDHIKKRIESRKGWKHTNESKEKMRIASVGNKHNVGRICSDETKHKISIAQISQNNHMFGKTHSEETKQKMREARKLYWSQKTNNTKK
jgi:NUMOD3 motif